ncbi:hypothetical protein L0128_15505, partial [candidate division KSB1 bacterium]|nr:hypothetical protein [candidate division KSB1 bacterium]
GGGDGQKMAKLTKFNSLAGQEGFIVAYPDGYEQHWNDGRQVESFETHQKGVDDVLFISKMIEAIHKIHPIDSTRIFATGISNGGIFCHYLAGHLSPRIAAIAPVVANMAVPFHEQFNPTWPVSVLIIQGEKDKLIPINGGEVARGNRGEVISMDATIQKWLAANDCTSEVTRGNLPDLEPDDGCKVEWTTYQNCQPGIELKVLLIKGGGHTWPGGPQYRSKFVIGNVCRDFSATEMIWEFFKNHPRQN